VINSNDKTQVKIGLLDGDNLYGIQLNDSDGRTVMEHGSDGELWISGELNVGLYKDSPTVKIGALMGLKN
jgi:hypothetical protein